VKGLRAVPLWPVGERIGEGSSHMEEGEGGAWCGKWRSGGRGLAPAAVCPQRRWAAVKK
jgi:hypothetical protein